MDRKNAKLFSQSVVLSVLVMAAIVSFGVRARADGIIIPEPPPHLIRPNVPIDISIKYHKVKVTINEGVAVTEIDQAFVSHYPEVIEGTYVFPLPEGAAISQLEMYINGVKVKGELLEKDKARQIYEDIVRRMRDPALLEYADRGMYKLRIYPINPGEEKRIQLKYSQTLKSDFGLTQYRYPLDTERFSVDPIDQVVVNVSLSSHVPIRNVYSPTHAIDVDRESDRKVRAVFEANKVKPDRDFILYYSQDTSDFGAGVLTYPDPDDNGGYFLLMVAPRSEVKQGERIAKDVVIVQDTSGSMSGEKIEQAKRAMKFILNSLDKGDRFGIITFATDINPYKPDMLQATSENVKKALSFADKLDASGGTNIFDAAKAAFKLVSKSKRPAYVLFITDGLPTVGLTEKDEIIKELKKLDHGKTRLFTFGVGLDVNFPLIDQMADDNGGASDYVAPDEDMEVKISNFYRKVKDPVLSDVSIAVNGVETFDVHPREVKDIFAGSQIIMAGRYRNKGKASVVIKGETQGKKVSYTYNVRFPSDPEEESIPILWANRRIGYLLDQIRLHGNNQEIVDEIVKLSKRFGIVTPYTSYLVQEDQIARRGRGEAPGVSASEGTFAAAPSVAMPSEQSGSGAYDAAKSSRDLEEADNISGTEHGIINREQVKTIGARAFYLKNGYWTQSDYKEEKATEVKFLSDAYFQLGKKYPDAGQFLSLGDKLVLKLGGKWYKIVP